MRAHAPGDHRYPDAALIFVPGVPTGSSPPASTFKVAIDGLDGLTRHVTDTGNNPWDLSQWHRFAQHLQLRAVTEPKSAYCPTLAKAEQLLAQYKAAFQRTYGRVGADLIPCACRIGQDLADSDEVIRRIEGDKGSILILGPSGCGKTMLATKAGIALTALAIPMLLPARDFAGQLKPLLDREAALLDAPSAMAVIKAARQLSVPLVIIVDGYNECPAVERESFSRALAAVTRRFEGRLLVTSQIALERRDLLPVQQFTVQEPDATLKLAIASAAADGTLRNALHPLLETVSSGMEAHLIGTLNRSLMPGTSRYGIFDLYTRERLQHEARAGIRLLSRVAGTMATRLTFSISVRDLDRLADAEQMPTSAMQAIERAKLLLRRGDRVSFPHELFFNAFAAECVLREAGEQPAVLVNSLRLPRYESSKQFVLGAIDSHAFLDQVLSSVDDPKLLLACREGVCGATARQWVRHKTAAIVEQMKLEALQARFEVNETGWDGIAPDATTLLPWTPSERAMMTVISKELWDGEYLDAILEVAGLLDERLAEDRIRLKDDPRLRKGLSVKSSLFASAYVFDRSKSTGLTHVIAPFHTAALSFHFDKSTAPPPGIALHLQRNDLSNGQLYVLVTLCQRMNLPADVFAPTLPKLYQSERWRTFPYHLQLDALDLAVRCADVTGLTRDTLVESLNDLISRLDPIMVDGAFEALGRLGALDDECDSHAEEVRRQVEELLARYDEPEAWPRAWHLYSCQFDHPYSNAYCAVFNELPEPSKKSLLTMACKGVSRMGMFLSLLISDLAEYGDPALGRIIERWTQLPDNDSSFTQDAVEVFLVSHIVLGQLNCQLPEQQQLDSPASMAMTACGALFYWMSRAGGVTTQEKNHRCDDAWRTLLLQRDVAACVLYHGDRSLRNGLPYIGKSKASPSLLQAYPERVAAACREALRHPERQTGYFGHFEHHRPDVLRFAINILGRCGTTGDISLLRNLSEDLQFGTDAIAAIKQLEHALSSLESARP